MTRPLDEFGGATVRAGLDPAGQPAVVIEVGAEWHLVLPAGALRWDSAGRDGDQ